MGTDGQNSADDDALDPAVAAILESARARDAPDRRLSVDTRSLPDALGAAEGDGRAPVIAEVKPTSPTTDGVRADDPVALAEQMVAGGAAALSVLTEPEHFGGSPETLRAVRAAVDVPVLRKDFLLEEGDLDLVAADVVLLIARFVDDLEGLIGAARERGFQVLVEVHTAGELAAALAAGADLVGVNNRDLASLTVDRSTFERVAAAVPADADPTLIAESGVETTEHVRAMRAAGADGLLIGTAIMDGDVRANTRRLTNA